MKKNRAWLLFAGLAVLYLLSLRAYYVGFFNDDAFYVIGARSLLQGRYVELNSPDLRPLDNYPPGYPLLLAQWTWLWGRSLLGCQLLSVLLTLGGIFLSWKVLAKNRPGPAPAAACAAAALSPLTVSLSGVVLSEPPYFFLTLFVLFCAAQVWERKDLRTWALLGALAGYCCLVRITGAALLLALAGALGLERRWRQAAVAAFSGAAVSLPYFLRNSFLTGRAETRLDEILDPYATWTRAGDMIAAAARNAAFYGHEVFARSLFRWPEGLDAGVLGAATALLAAGACAWGLRLWGWKGFRKFMPLYLFLYGLIHLAWPYQAGRYAYPILPFLTGLLFLGVEAAGRRWGRSEPAVGGALALSLLLSAAPTARVVRASLFERTPLNAPPQHALGWIRDHADLSAVIAGELDGRIHLLTGRRTLHLPKGNDVPAMDRWLRSSGADFILNASHDPVMRRAAGAGEHDALPAESLSVLLADEDRYELAFFDEGEGISIYRVKAPRPDL